MLGCGVMERWCDRNAVVVVSLSVRVYLNLDLSPRES